MMRGVLAGMVVALVLAGCAASPQETGAPDSTPDPTPTAELVARPASVWDLECPRLVAPSDLAAVTSAALVETDYRFDLPFAEFVPNSAVLQAGGSACAWNSATLGLRWELTAWPDPDGAGYGAESGYLTGQQIGAWTPIDAFDGAAASCDGRSDTAAGIRCRWIAHSHGVTIRAEFWEVLPSEVQNPDPAPNPDTGVPPLRPSGAGAIGLFGDVFNRIAAAPVVQLEPMPPAAAPPCEQRLTAAAVESALGMPSSSILYARATDEPAGALASIGGSGCFASSSDVYVVATVGPGLAWSIENALAIDPDLSVQPIAGLDQGVVRCALDEGGAYCQAAAVDGGDLLSVTLTTSTTSPTAEQASALLTAMRS